MCGGPGQDHYGRQEGHPAYKNRVVGCWCGCLQCCIAKNGGGYTQTGVPKGLKVPCLFMIAEVSIRCQKNPGSWYTPYTRVYPQYTTGCLSGAGYRQLYDLHVNSMTYTLFFIPDYQFQKVFIVSFGNNFFTFFCGGPVVVEAPGLLPSLPPR